MLNFVIVFVAVHLVQKTLRLQEDEDEEYSRIKNEQPLLITYILAC
jgi:ABC-type uncharacterized transport system permease subunit